MGGVVIGRVLVLPFRLLRLDSAVWYSSCRWDQPMNVKVYLDEPNCPRYFSHRSSGGNVNRPFAAGGVGRVRVRHL